MSRLIDADALLEVLESTRYGHIQRLKDLITNAPTDEREGWVSVPIDPTWEMLNRASERTDVDSFSDIKDVWEAMLSAAPKE